MNKMNGGYVMITHDASQTKLKNAYESLKPVLYYDATGRGFYASIIESGGTYSVLILSDKISDLIDAVDVLNNKKLYLHVVTVTGTSSSDIIQFVVNIYNHDDTAFTKESLYTFVENKFIVATGYYYVSASTTTYTVNAISASLNRFELIQNIYLNEYKQYSVNSFSSCTDIVTEV